jgi:hypothetical protein
VALEQWRAERPLQRLNMPIDRCAVDAKRISRGTDRAKARDHERGAKFHPIIHAQP